MKLALIGGGSVRTVYFFESLLKFCEKLDITQVSVMDNDPRKLAIFGSFVQYMTEQAKVKLEVTVTGDLKSAVENADFVVTTIRAGQDEARCHDERIALNYNVIGQETTGAGGFSYALRSIPAMLEIVRMIEKYARKTVKTFNFTNPSGLVTQAMHDKGFEVIGICDNATEIKINLARTLKLNSSEFFVRSYGLNHLTWADQVVVQNKNILPLLIDNVNFRDNFHPFSYFDRDLIQMLGKIPNGYLFYYYHREKALQNMLKSPRTRGESIRKINAAMMEELDRIRSIAPVSDQIRVFRDYMGRREGSYMKMELGGAKEELAPINLEDLGLDVLARPVAKPELQEGYAGVVFNYIESYLLNKRVDLTLNVPNKGAIEDLGDDDIIEITCDVDSGGARPVRMGSIQEEELALIRQIKLFEKLTIKYVFEKKQEYGIRALMQHPLVGSYSLARALVREYEELNRKYGF